ncbi:MAG TPA: hypothetical protein VI248_19130 [Kineosporiaceae bacterium]
MSNVVAVIVSVVALIVSSVSSRRQDRISHGANLMTILGGAFASFRTPAFISAQNYVYYKMGQHDVNLGYRGLPEEIRQDILMVSHFYNDLGRMVAYEALDEDVAVPSFGGALHQSWETLRPFIEKEREFMSAEGRVRFMVYFEDMACRVRRRYDRGEDFYRGLLKW